MVLMLLGHGVAAIGVAGATVYLAVRPPAWLALVLVPLSIPMGTAFALGDQSGRLPISFSDLSVIFAMLYCMLVGVPLHRRVLTPALVLITWSVATVPFSAVHGLAISGLKTVVLSCALLVTSASVARTGKVPRAAVAVGATLGCTVVALLVLSAIRKSGANLTDSVTLKSPSDISIGRSNYVAAIMVLGLTAGGLAFPLVRRWWRIVLAVVCAPLLVLAVVATGSRSQTAALGLSLLAISWFIFRSWRKGRALIGFGVPMVCFVAFQALQDYLSAIWLPAIQRGVGGYSSLQARESIWSDVWQQFLESPVGGVGLQNLEWNGQYVMAHDWALQVLAETGIVGSIFYLILLIAAVRCSSGPYRLMALIIVLIAVASGLIEPTMRTRDYDYLFWLLLGSMALPLSQSNEDDESFARQDRLV